jgi:hypothetical protein
MTWLLYTFIAMVVCDTIVVAMLLLLIAKLHRDVEYLKKKVVQVESIAELARSNAYLARRNT